MSILYYLNSTWVHLYEDSSVFVNYSIQAVGKCTQSAWTNMDKSPCLPAGYDDYTYGHGNPDDYSMEPQIGLRGYDV